MMCLPYDTYDAFFFKITLLIYIMNICYYTSVTTHILFRQTLFYNPVCFIRLQVTVCAVKLFAVKEVIIHSHICDWNNDVPKI